MALDPGKKKVYKRKTGATYDGRSRMNKKKRGSGGPTKGRITGYGQLHPSKTEGFGPVYTEEGTKKANMSLPGEPEGPSPWNVPKTPSGSKHKTFLVKSKSKRKRGGKGWQII